MDKIETIKLYADLKIKEKEISTKLKELNPDVLNFVSEIQGDSDLPVEVSGKGKFIIEMRKEWKYSDAYEAKKLELAELQAEEQAKGIATFKESPTLKFNSIKIG